MANKKFKFVDLSDELFIDNNDKLENQSEPKQNSTETNKLNESVSVEKPFNNFSNNNVSELNTKQTDINKFISVKEKLEIKTNIYLKPNLVLKIKKICDETGNSRSSIINKLLELAIKEFE